MRYGQMRKYDIANGLGIRTSLFVTGCTHKCYNCFNEDYQNFKAGKEWTDEDLATLLEYLSDDNVDGLTLLGGEPMQNIQGLLPVVAKVRETVPQKTIWVYSGYTFDEILKLNGGEELLSYCDVLVDGRYEDELRDPALQFRGSANQRILDVKESLAKREPVLYKL